MTSEDCLFLNIFAPERANGTSNIPVMVYIHGGWFMAGASNIFDGKILSAFGDVVVVTINYRLAQLGFLRVDDDEGNFGLWDQHLALKWVKANIASFGGDVNNITIFGISAGSTSVVYQTFFPQNKGLFQRAIAQSGSITSQYGFNTNKTATRLFDEFTMGLNCNGSHAQIMACLRQKSSKDMQDGIDKANFFDVVLPNRDNAFVPQNPIDMLKDTPENRQSHEFFRSLDLITSAASLEGSLFIFYFAAQLNVSNVEQLMVPKNVYENLFIPDILADVFDNVDTIPQVVKDVTIFEYTDWKNPDDPKERLKQLLDLATHAAVLAPTISTIQLHAQSQSLAGSSYLYQFSTHANSLGDRRLPSWIDGPDKAKHGDDYLFTCGFPEDVMSAIPGNPSVTSDDINTSKAVMTMFSNFAKSGNPNLPRDITQYLPATWLPYQMTSQKYLDITSTMTSASVKQNIQAEKMQFWLHYLPTLFP